MLNDKFNRMINVNLIIKEIGDRGRRTFYKPKYYGYAHFTIEGKNLWFVDDYTGEKIYPYMGISNHKGFSHGGTMWALVNDFREHIITGKKTNGNFGYGGLYCSHWGYSEEDMKAIQEKAKEVGFL